MTQGEKKERSPSKNTSRKLRLLVDIKSDVINNSLL
jgi:hypothetical protein